LPTPRAAGKFEFAQMPEPKVGDGAGRVRAARRSEACRQRPMWA